MMYEPVIAQVGPMVKPDIPDPPRFWIVRFFEYGKWDWNLAQSERRRDSLIQQCAERRQPHQVLTIPGVATDE